MVTCWSHWPASAMAVPRRRSRKFGNRSELNVPNRGGLEAFVSSVGSARLSPMYSPLSFRRTVGGRAWFSARARSRRLIMRWAISAANLIEHVTSVCGVECSLSPQLPIRSGRAASTAASDPARANGADAGWLATNTAISAASSHSSMAFSSAAAAVRSEPRTLLTAPASSDVLIAVDAQRSARG